MQQATVNLLADMGAQPATLQAGLVAGDGVDRHDAADRRRSRPAGAARRVAAGSAVTITGTAARRRRRRSAASRSRPTAARPGAGHGPRELDLHLDAAAAGTVTLKPRAVDDSGNLETPPARRRPSTVGPAQALPVQHLDDATVARRSPAMNDTSAVELGVKFRTDVDGFVTGSASTRARRNTGTHIGHLWTSGRHAPRRPATFTGEIGVGLAGGAVRDAGRDRRASTTYVASYHTPSGTTRSTAATSRAPASTTRRCTRSRDGDDGAERRLPATAPSGLPRPRRSRRRTTGSTSCSRRDRPGHDGPDRPSTSPAAGAHAASRPRRDVTADVQRADRRGHASTSDVRAARRQRTRSSRRPSPTTRRRGPRARPERAARYRRRPTPRR